ncbi:MAG TPA: helix-turn-helix transcriptional regulator [Solirubrobacteraceae bacterium]|jgi:transcriptional regulator with XRE-family HTH domain|nr:helix-turn-helix transcriptional regulator [Solirubrobacteraceae bacterium]
MAERGRERVALGQTIRRERQARQLSIEALAFEAGVSVARLGRIERGQGSPKVSELLALSNVLGVTLGDLMVAAWGEA